MNEQRVLPADVFDTLEFSALVFGGIGARWLTLPSDDSGDPYCVYGHSGYVTNSDDEFSNPVARALDRILETPDVGWPNGAGTNNSAVRAINARKGADEDARVTWKEYTRELNIRRGD